MTRADRDAWRDRVQRAPSHRSGLVDVIHRRTSTVVLRPRDAPIAGAIRRPGRRSRSPRPWFRRSRTAASRSAVVSGHRASTASFVGFVMLARSRPGANESVAVATARRSTAPTARDRLPSPRSRHRTVPCVGRRDAAHLVGARQGIPRTVVPRSRVRPDRRDRRRGDRRPTASRRVRRREFSDRRRLRGLHAPALRTAERRGAADHARRSRPAQRDRRRDAPAAVACLPHDRRRPDGARGGRHRRRQGVLGGW